MRRIESEKVEPRLVCARDAIVEVAVHHERISVQDGCIGIGDNAFDGSFAGAANGQAFAGQLHLGILNPYMTRVKREIGRRFEAELI